MEGMGQRIAALRKKLDLNQAQLAEKLNVSSSTIAMWETNNRAIKDEDLSSLADFFNVTTDYLLGRNKTPEWASKEEILELDKILSSNVGMAYGDEGPMTKEDREAIDDLIASYFWRKKQKKLKSKKQE